MQAATGLNCLNAGGAAASVRPLCRPWRAPAMTLLISYILLALGVSFVCSILEATLRPSPRRPSTARSRSACAGATGWRRSRRTSTARYPRSSRSTPSPTPWARPVPERSTPGFTETSGSDLRRRAHARDPDFHGNHSQDHRCALFGIAGRAGFCFAGFHDRRAQAAGLGSQQITRLFTKRCRGPLIHREEMLAMARMARNPVRLGQRESQFVQNLIQLHAMKAWDIMTPRPVIFALPQSTLLVDFIKMVEDKPFTRIPVYKGTFDEMVGFVIRGDVLLAHLKNADLTSTLAEVTRPLAVTQEYIAVDILFQRFIAERHQIMLVTDEFGTTVGLITFEDIIETIFGFEIMDEKDKVADLQLDARNLWHQRARRMGIELPEEETWMKPKWSAEFIPREPAGGGGMNSALHENKNEAPREEAPRRSSIDENPGILRNPRPCFRREQQLPRPQPQEPACSQEQRFPSLPQPPGNGVCLKFRIHGGLLGGCLFRRGLLTAFFAAFFRRRAFLAEVSFLAAGFLTMPPSVGLLLLALQIVGATAAFDDLFLLLAHGWCHLARDSAPRYQEEFFTKRTLRRFAFDKSPAPVTDSRPMAGSHHRSPSTHFSRSRVGLRHGNQKILRRSAARRRGHAQGFPRPPRSARRFSTRTRKSSPAASRAAARTSTSTSSPAASAKPSSSASAPTSMKRSPASSGASRTASPA